MDSLTLMDTRKMAICPPERYTCLQKSVHEVYFGHLGLDKQAVASCIQNPLLPLGRICAVSLGKPACAVSFPILICYSD